MKAKKINLSDPSEIKLEFEGKRENSFSIACFGLNGGGIPIENYKEVREKAKKLATTHPDWPAGLEPSDEVIWEGEVGLFTIKPQTGAA